MRKGSAIGYIDGHKFFFEKGRVFYKTKLVGEYDRRTGMGRLNEKPFQLVPAGNGREYLIVEMREAA